MQNQSIRKKVDLLKFQKTLNDQFLEIFDQKNKEVIIQNQATDALGLSAFYEQMQFFIPLKDLKTISIQNEFENSVRTKSWILGFNQDRGDVYTILNFKKVVDLILNNKTDFSKADLNADSRIVYLRATENGHHAVLLEKLKLDYTAEFTPLFNFSKKPDTISWSFAEDIDFASFVNKEKMSEVEWNLLNKIHQHTLLGESFEEGNYPQEDREHLLSLMIKSVYLDSFGEKPIFVLNVPNLTKFLINVSPI